MQSPTPCQMQQEQSDEYVVPKPQQNGLCQGNCLGDRQVPSKIQLALLNVWAASIPVPPLPTPPCVCCYLRGPSRYG